MNSELELYKKRVEREKRARKEAEMLLEEKSLQLYESNKKLLKVNENQEKIILERTAKLQTSENNYQSLVESISDLICKLSLNGSISFVNKVTCLTLGYEMDEIIGQNIFKYVSPKYKSKAFRFAAKMLLSHNCLGYNEFPICTKDGREIWLGINIQFFEKKCLICDDKPCFLSGKLKKITSKDCSYGEVIVVARDISKQLEAKRIVEEQSEKLRNNEKYLKTINQFATSILKHNTIDEIVWEVMQLTIEELGFVDCIVYLLDDDKKNLAQRAAYGPKKLERKSIKNPILIPLGKGIVGNVANTGIPELIPDTSKDPRYIVDDQNRLSELTVPIIADGEIIGVIDTEHPEKNFYTPEHLERLKTVAGLVSSRMKNAISQEKLLLAQNSLTKLSTAVEQSPLSVVITDVNGIIEFVNPTFVETTGYSENESIGKKTNLLKSGAHPDSLYLEMWEKIKKGEKWVGELINKRKNGDLFWVLSSISPIKNKNGIITNFVGMQADISASKKLENELIKAKETAEKANKSKSEFLANMSHEIRTPMNAILGFSEVLFHELESSKHKKIIKSVLGSGNLLLTLLNDILDLSKIEAGKLEITKSPCNLRNVLREIILLFSEKAKEKGLELQTQISEQFPTYVMVDEIRVKQVLFNLIGNAIKFTNNGYVHVKLAFYAAEQRTGELFIEIEDTGIGIHKEHLDSIFNVFSQESGQASRTHHGAGLGLSITKRLVEKMNGIIEVQSMPNKGSVFSVSLFNVTTIENPAKQKDKYSTNKEIQFKDATILIVDDIKLNIKLVENFLADTSLKTISVVSAEAALQVLNQTPPDLILLDIRMPKIDGYSLARMIKENPKYEHIPIVAFTASVHSSDKLHKSKHFNGILFKPINRNELFIELSKHLKYVEAYGSISQSNNIHNYDLSPAQLILLPEVTKKLKEHFLPKWKMIKDEFVLFKIEEFANELQEFAIKYNINFLLEYTQKMNEDLEIVDLDSISAVLSEFPEIVNQICDLEDGTNKERDGKF